MIQFAARFYDGQSSNALDVSVEVDDSGLMRILGTEQPREYSLSRVRIAPRLGRTARTIALPDGAQCESEDHAALDALMQKAGGGKGGALVHALESNWRSALAATAVLTALIAVGIRWGIPFAAKQIAYAIPPALAYDMGRGTLAILDGSLLKPTALPAERQADLRSGFQKMAKNYPELPLHLNFRRGVGPNAFALPNGAVIVTDELVELAKNDYQVYGVLAHEIGHVHHRHALRMALESSTVLIVLSTYFGDVTQLSALTSSLPSIVVQSHYSREHEYEADSFAMLYLDRARIPRRHFADILRTLQAAAGGDSDTSMKYLASHPPTSERVSRFE